MKLIRIVAPHFVAGFETDGTVRRAAPIISYMVGCSDEQVRAYIKRKGWKASVIDHASCPDTSDIPETDEAWFKLAKLVKPDGTR